LGATSCQGIVNICIAIAMVHCV